MSRRAHERLTHREKVVERRDRMLIHDKASERATIEEVFDQKTRMVIFDLMNEGVIHELNGVVSSGKGSRSLLGKNKEEGSDIAVKISTALARFKGA